MRLSRPVRCLSGRGFQVDKGSGSGWARLIWPGYLRGSCPIRVLGGQSETAIQPIRPGSSCHGRRVAKMSFKFYANPNPSTLWTPDPGSAQSVTEWLEARQRRCGTKPSRSHIGCFGDCVTTRFSRERPSGNIAHLASLPSSGTDIGNHH